ncbi:MAG: hexitol phosphatase HxpB [bacterium]|nr:hexitol phosphatase HxpB [bacterium]
MIKAAIFDMDGLLINSEPFWKQAEIDVFKDVNIHLTWDMAKSTSGLREDEAINYWFAKYPWNNISKEEVLNRIENKVIKGVNKSGLAMPGVEYILSLFKENNVPTALASASMNRVINAVVDKLNIRTYFQVIYSAEHEEYGKPHPGVYITTAKKLGINPEECIAFEDSPRGLIATKAAEMKCIVVPEAKMKNDKRFGIADLILNSLEDFKIDIFTHF